MMGMVPFAKMLCTTQNLTCTVCLCVFAEAAANFRRQEVLPVPARAMPHRVGDLLPHLLVLGEPHPNAAQTLCHGQAWSGLQEVSPKLALTLTQETALRFLLRLNRVELYYTGRHSAFILYFTTNRSLILQQSSEDKSVRLCLYSGNVQKYLPL